MVEEVRKSAALPHAGVEIEGAVSTAFGCTMQGAVPEDDVLRIAAALAQFCDGVALADTVGYANPAQVRRLFRRVKAEIGEKLEGAHFHNTRGLGLANALAAYEEGVRAFDSSMGGLGGCPFAPGASGNVITEDLVFMFEAMGVHTGIDLEKLFAARRILVEAIPEEPVYGHTPLAGLPKGFRATA
jgi:hydroxymethylglutaryl-CoA lyase